MRCAGALSFLGVGERRRVGKSEVSDQSHQRNQGWGKIREPWGSRDGDVRRGGNCLGGFFLAVLKVVCIFVGDKKGFEEAGFVTGFV